MEPSVLRGSGMMGRMMGRALPLLFALGSVAFAGCAAQSDDAASADADISATHLTDAQLAAALAKPPTSLAPSTMRKVIGETVSPLATTARLKLLNDFIAGREHRSTRTTDTPYAAFAFDDGGDLLGDAAGLRRARRASAGSVGDADQVDDDGDLGRRRTFAAWPVRRTSSIHTLADDHGKT